MIFLDTHIVVWLYEGRIDKLSQKCIESIEEKPVFISPIVLLELDYLFEIQKIAKDSSKIMRKVSDDIGIRIHDVSLHSLIQQARNESWTRDPFDRLIVSHCKLEKSSLWTSDKTIRKHCLDAHW